MQRKFFAVYTVGIEVLQHAVSKMKTGSRRRYRAFNLGVNCLVSCFITLLRIPIQVGRYR